MNAEIYCWASLAKVGLNVLLWRSTNEEAPSPAPSLAEVQFPVKYEGRRVLAETLAGTQESRGGVCEWVELGKGGVGEGEEAQQPQLREHREMSFIYCRYQKSIHGGDNLYLGIESPFSL